MKQSLLGTTAVWWPSARRRPRARRSDRRHALACEALLCLSSGTRPSECCHHCRATSASISGSFRRRSRRGLTFLNLCPVSNQTPEMAALVSAISRGAGRCDAPSLNRMLVIWNSWDEGHFVISDRLPHDCSAYVSHTYTDFSTTIPRYVGTPERGGYWVEARDYDRALADLQRSDPSRGREAVRALRIRELRVLGVRPPAVYFTLGGFTEQHTPCSSSAVIGT